MREFMEFWWYLLGSVVAIVIIVAIVFFAGLGMYAALVDVVGRTRPHARIPE